MVSDLAPTLRQFRTEICGPGWDAAKLPFCRDEEVDTAGLTEAYASARVVLNVGRQGSPANDRYQLDPSTPAARTFEAAMAGCCQLYFADSLEVLDYFDLGTEILLFDDADDFRGQLTAILSDGERQRSIGAAAQRRALAEHTYAHRRGPWWNASGWTHK